MTRRTRFFLILAAIVLMMVLAGAWLLLRKPAEPMSSTTAAPAGAPGKTGAASAGSRASLAVETVVPVQADWPLTLTANGALASWQEATISAETGGLRIVALHADVGTRVRRGQLLAELNGDTVKADVRKVEASVAAAQARQREAQANVKRGNAVRESGSLSGQQIEQYEITQQTAAAELQSAQADLASARIRLQQTRIVAVDDGIIAARSATLGAVVASGAELFRLQRDARVEWRAEVDALQLAQLRVGMSASIDLPGGASVTGRIRQLAPTLDDKTRNALVYVDLPRQEQIRSGLYVTGRFALGQRNATVVPASAVTMRDGRAYVFEIDRQRQTVMQREVVTGRSRGEQIEILSGMHAGAMLVKTGGGFLNDGDAVRVAGNRSGSTNDATGGQGRSGSPGDPDNRGTQGRANSNPAGSETRNDTDKGSNNNGATGASEGTSNSSDSADGASYSGSARDAGSIRSGTTAVSAGKFSHSLGDSALGVAGGKVDGKEAALRAAALSGSRKAS